MRKSLSVKSIVQGKTVAQRIFQEKSGVTGESVVLKASAEMHFLLQDIQTGLAPHPITFRKFKNHLHLIIGDATDQSPDLIIEDFFIFQNTQVYGLSDNGQIQRYQFSNPDLLPAQNSLSKHDLTQGSQMPENQNSGLSPDKDVLKQATYKVVNPESQFIDSTLLRLGLIAGGAAILGSSKKSETAKTTAQEALDKITAYAVDNSKPTPTLEDYTAAGVTPFNASQLLSINSAVDAQSQAKTVDTAAKIQALVNSYGLVLAEANGATADATPTDDPTLSDYQRIGVELKAILGSDAGLRLFNDIIKGKSTAGVNTVTKLNALATVVDQLLTVAENGNVSTSLTEADFSAIGITGVTTANLSALNSVLATRRGKLDTLDHVQKIQDIANAYTVILAEANGVLTDQTSANPSAADYAAVGVVFSSQVSQSTQLALLNDIVATKSADAVDSFTKLNSIAKSVSSLMLLAADQDITLKFEDLAPLGLRGLTISNLTGLSSTIKASLNDGSAIDTLRELQALVSIEVIKAYAEDKLQVAPTVQDYKDAGVHQINNNVVITDANIETFNTFIDALAPAQVGTAALLKDMVASYQKLQTKANGSSSDTTIDDPLAADYSRLGIQLGLALPLQPAGLGLLNDIVKSKNAADIDTYTELADLKSTVEHLMTLTSVSDTSSATQLTNELSSIGLRGVNDQISSNIKSAMLATADDGSGINSLAKLQALVSYETLYAYANDTNAIKPIVADYSDIGISNVLSDNLGAINSAIDVLSVNDFNTQLKLQAIVDSYTSILSEANGTDQDRTPNVNPTVTDFTRIGVNLGLVATNTPSLELLNDTIAESTTTAVNSVSKISNLARIVGKIMSFAAKPTGDTSTNGAPSVEELTDIGLNVSRITTEDEVRSVWQAIINSEQSDVNSLSKLQDLITRNVII
jgi:hypothetical protein